MVPLFEDGDNREVEVAHRARDPVHVPVGVDVRRVGPHDISHVGGGPGPDVRSRGARADEASFFVESEHDVQGLNWRRRGPHRLESSLDGRRGWHCGVVGAHEAASGLRWVAEEVPNLALLGFGHELEQWQPALLIHFADEVCRVVRRHPRKESRRIVVGALVDELELVLGVELLEHVGLELAVESDGLDDLLALLVAGRLDEVGDLGRMQPGEAPVRDPESSGGYVTYERLDLGEVDDARRRDPAPKAPAEEPAEQGASPNVDTHDLPRAVDVGKLDLVRRDEAPAHEVDEVPSEQVMGEQDLTGAPLEATQVNPLALEPRAAPLDRGDLADGHEQIASPDTHDDADHGRVGAT